MLITKTSMFTGKTHTMELPVTEAQFAHWKAGALVQEAFPNLTISQREFLLTGTTQEEWDTLYGPGHYVDEDEQPEGA